MKNTMIPVVTLATALTAEYGTIHVCALNNDAVYTEHDFSDTSDSYGIQEDEMEYQKAKKDAENKQAQLNLVSEQYELAQNNTVSAKQALEQECERIVNDSQNELLEAEKETEEKKESEQEALSALATAENNLSVSEKQLQDAKDSYQKLLDDLHIPSFALDSLNQQLEDKQQEYRDTLSIKNETITKIDELKLELSSQYLNLTSLKTNAELKYEILTSAKQKLSETKDFYNRIDSELSAIDEQYPDISASISVIQQNKESAQKQMSSCQSTLDDYNQRKSMWEEVQCNGVQSNNLMYNATNGYYYKPEDVAGYLSEIYTVIENNTRDYEQANASYTQAISELNTLSDLKEKRDQLVSNKSKLEDSLRIDQESVNNTESQYATAKSDYDTLYQHLSSLSDRLDNKEENLKECNSKIEDCSADMDSIQSEIDALNKLLEISDVSSSRVAFSNDSRSYTDLWNEIVCAKNNVETGKEAVKCAKEELQEKKEAEESALNALQQAEVKSQKAKEKYENARAAVLEIHTDGKLTSSEFSYLNQYLLAYNEAVKKENQLRKSYEQAKLEYDIAAGLIAPGSDLYNRHMKYIESLNVYEKMTAEDSSLPETATKKAIENTSVNSRRINTKQVIGGLVLTSSLVFATFSIMKVKNSRHEHM